MFPFFALGLNLTWCQTIIRDYDLTRVCLPRLAEFYAEVSGGGAPGMPAARGAA